MKSDDKNKKNPEKNPEEGKKKRLANLRPPFKAGEPSANPDGRPLGKRNKETIFNIALLKLTEKYVEDHNKKPGNKKKQITIADVDIESDVFMQLVNKARLGHMKAIEVFMDHRHGKAQQTLIHKGDAENPVVVEERRAKKREAVKRMLTQWTAEDQATDDGVEEGE